MSELGGETECCLGLIWFEDVKGFPGKLVDCVGGDIECGV